MMRKSAAPHVDSRRFPGAGVFLLYALIIVAMVPRTVVARGDEFGYLESTILTIWNHWPTTSDWLEPSNALFSALTALAYGLTRDFYLATFGLLIVFTIANFFLLNVVLKRWAPVSTASRHLIGFALVTSPVYLDKSVSFIGVIPALFFMLLALICYVDRLYRGFFLSVIAAFMVREDAIMLLAVPACILLWKFVQDGRHAAPLAWRLGPGIATVVATAIAVKLSMNATYSQLKIDYRTLETLSLATFGQCLITGLVVSLFLYLGFQALLAVEASRPTLGERVAANPVGFSALAILTAASLFLSTPAIKFDLPQPGPMRELTGQAEGVVLLALANLALGLWRGISLPWRSPLLATQIGWIVLVSLHGQWWDYYFIEIALLSLLLACESTGRNASNVEGRPLALGAVAALVAILVLNALFGVYLKFQIERDTQSIQILETMVRDGELAPEEVAAAPFGFAGWKLYEPWLEANAGKTFISDSQFMEVLSDANVIIRWRPTASEAALPGCSILRSGEAWFVGVRFYYSVDRCGPPARKAELPDMACRVLPLTEREWELAIHGTPCSAAPHSRNAAWVGPSLER